MLSAVRAALTTPDLRKKILFTLAIVAVYRLGANIPSPGVSYPNIQECVRQVEVGDNASVWLGSDAVEQESSSMTKVRRSGPPPAWAWALGCAPAFSCSGRRSAWWAMHGFARLWPHWGRRAGSRWLM